MTPQAQSGRCRFPPPKLTWCPAKDRLENTPMTVFASEILVAQDSEAASGLPFQMSRGARWPSTLLKPVVSCPSDRRNRMTLNPRAFPRHGWKGPGILQAYILYWESPHMSSWPGRASLRSDMCNGDIQGTMLPRQTLPAPGPKRTGTRVHLESV